MIGGAREKIKPLRSIDRDQLTSQVSPLRINQILYVELVLLYQLSDFVFAEW